jgi:hypothetical protein
VTRIGSYGFFASAFNVTELTFPKVETIEDKAFDGNAYESVTSITTTRNNYEMIFAIFGDTNKKGQNITYNVIE